MRNTHMKLNGIILIMALLLLVIMSLLAVVSMRTTSIGEKMIGNRKNSMIAFQAAESALKEGENTLKSSTVIPIPCSQSPCLVWANGSLPLLSTVTTNWWDTNATSYSQSISGLYSPPKYVIEQFSFIPDSLNSDDWASGKGNYYYEISAYSSGGSSSTSVITQSIYSTRYN